MRSVSVDVSQEINESFFTTLGVLAGTDTRVRKRLTEIVIELLQNVRKHGCSVTGASLTVVKEVSHIQIRSGQSFSARMAKTVVNNLDGFLAATHLGITLASLGLGWIGEGVVSKIILAIFHGLGLELDETVAHSIALPCRRGRPRARLAAAARLCPVGNAIRARQIV